MKSNFLDCCSEQLFYMGVLKYSQNFRTTFKAINIVFIFLLAFKTGAALPLADD